MQHDNLVFDSFIGETLVPLATGKANVLADEEEMMHPWRLADILSTHGVEIIQFTPPGLQMCLSNEAFLRAMSKVRSCFTAARR